MSMPALQAFRRLHPDTAITLLVKKSVRPLWNLHAAPDQILELDGGNGGTFRLACQLRRESFHQCFVLPHSFRSAWIPFLAGVPERIGLPGHFRDGMLTRVVRPVPAPGRIHQAYEYMELMAPSLVGEELEPPRLVISENLTERARTLLAEVPRPRAGLIPGAARGPAKQWPRKHFVEVGRRLVAEKKCGVVVLGSPAEAPLCAHVAGAMGTGAVSLAGKTTLEEWVAVLKECDVVIANDSGGMHVAAAVGTPVVVLYGLTDPARTGPLTSRCAILQESPERARDIPRESAEARKWLASIPPQRVYEAALSLLGPIRPD